MGQEVLKRYQHKVVNKCLFACWIYLCISRESMPDACRPSYVCLGMPNATDVEWMIFNLLYFCNNLFWKKFNSKLNGWEWLVRDQNFGIGILNLAWDGPFWQSSFYIQKCVKANNKMDLPANGYSRRRRKMITMKLSTTILWWFRNLLIISDLELLLKFGQNMVIFLRRLALEQSIIIMKNFFNLISIHLWFLSTLIRSFKSFCSDCQPSLNQVGITRNMIGFNMI